MSNVIRLNKQIAELFLASLFCVSVVIINSSVYLVHLNPVNLLCTFIGFGAALYMMKCMLRAMSKLKKIEEEGE